MPRMECGHAQVDDGVRVCAHLVDNANLAYCHRFRDGSVVYDLLCMTCRRNADEAPVRTMCSTCLRKLEATAFWDIEKGLLGSPEVRERESGLRFVHDQQCPTITLPSCPVDVRPVLGSPTPVWIAALVGGDLVCIDSIRGSVEQVGTIPRDSLDIRWPSVMQLSHNGEFAGIANVHRRPGAVLNTRTGQLILEFSRAPHRIKECAFPFDFCDIRGNTFLVHGVECDRLALTNLDTGVRVRGPGSVAREEPEDEYDHHHTEHVHSRLYVSPDQRWICESAFGDGGPVGVVAAWNMHRWLDENNWECADGQSKQVLYRCHQELDPAVCWVSDRTVAVQGYGPDSRCKIPAVQLFDVTTGERVKWFAGPVGELLFDEYLFACSEENGTSVWDVDTGERLLVDAEFCPYRFHPSGYFLIQSHSDQIAVARLEDQGTPEG